MFWQGHPLLASADSAFLIGASIPILLLLGGTIKCFHCLFSGEFERCSILSLTLFITAWFCSAILTAVQKVVGENEIVTLLVGLVYFFIFVAALILGIIGLMRLARPEHQAKRGRGQAIWGIVLSSILIVIYLGAAVFAAAGELGNLATDRGPVASETHINEASNIRLEAPGHPWMSLDVSKVNPDADVVYLRNDPTMVFTLIAERIGTSSGFDTEALVKFAKEQMQIESPQAEFIDLGEEIRNGIPYTTFVTETKKRPFEGGVERSLHWVTMHQGFAYQMSLGMDEFLSAENIRRMEQFADGLTLINPDLVISTQGATVPPLARSDLGIEVDLGVSGWVPYGAVENDYPEAHFAANRGHDEATGIMAFRLDELDPSIDELATGALAQGFGVIHPDGTFNRRVIEQGSAEGIELKTRSNAGGLEYEYRFRVLRDGEQVWTLAAWAQTQRDGFDRRLEETLSSYQLTTPVGPVANSEQPKATREAIANVHNQVGLVHFRRHQYRAAADWFSEADQLNPEDGQFYTNWLEALLNFESPEQVIELAEAGLERFPEWTDLHAVKANAYTLADEPESAINAYETAFAAGHAIEDDLLDCINICVDTEDRERGLGIIDAFLDQQESASYQPRKWKAQILIQLDRDEEATDLFDSLAEEFPFDAELASARIEAHLDLEQYDLALTRIDERVSSNVPSASTLFQKGKAHLGLEEYPDSKRAFEEASLLEPDNPEITEYLEYVSGMLGKGNTAMIQSEIAPVELPREVAEVIERARAKNPPDDAALFGAYLPVRSQGIDYREGEPLKRTNYIEVKILTKQAVEDFSTLRYLFDPLSQALFVNRVEVVDESGEVIAEGEVDDYYLVDHNSDILATTEKVVHVPVPGLRVGATLRAEVTRQGLGAARELGFFEYPLAKSVPSGGAILFVTGDIDKVGAQGNGAVEKLEWSEGVALFASPTTPTRDESNQPWTNHFSPFAWLSDAGLSWESVGDEYLTLLTESESEPSDHLVEVATELVIDCENDQEKIDAISSHIQNLLSYQGIEFGQRARIPNPVMDIIRNRYGDCKDHSVLLKEMLEAVGIEAHLCLVSVNSEIQPELPSLNQFDHMVVYVPRAAGSPFVDLTSDHTPAGWVAPQLLLGEQALVLEPDSIRLESIDLADALPDILESDREVSLLRDKSRLLVKETITARGYPACWMRSYFATMQGADRRERLTQALRDVGAPRIRSLDVKGLEVGPGPFVLEIEYELSSHVRKRDGEWIIRAPAIWERYFLEEMPASERNNPIEIMVSLEFASRCRLKIPDGTSGFVASDGGDGMSLKSDFRTWEIDKPTISGSTLLISSLATTHRGFFEAEQYDDYCEDLNAGLDYWSREYRFPVNP